ncbi:MAG: hypothetical protein LH702_17450, partial [Phormidesmis sp. CAN_BIN44]|nr:hypothetical protein [Phormidesmis sp. CAN_BIN44]
STLSQFGAQRLAASEVWIRILRFIQAQFHPCSTPCGIRGLDTLGTRSLSVKQQRAQRLAASEVWIRRSLQPLLQESP